VRVLTITTRIVSFIYTVQDDTGFFKSILIGEEMTMKSPAAVAVVNFIAEYKTRIFEFKLKKKFVTALEQLLFHFLIILNRY
jgi:hypothetical protein